MLYSNTLKQMQVVLFSSVPDECPDGGAIEECSTCCCESSNNVEFYDPDAPEPVCTAPNATYEVTFQFSWSAVCHPDYYFPGSLFTFPSVVSHNSQYRMWDACMDNPSIGVRSIAEQAITSILDQEYQAAGDNVLNSVVGDIVFSGAGSTSRTLAFDKDHQLVSAGLMLVPSFDRFLGVADLILCDGDQWKDEVKLCLELFSTATASGRVASEMERNSLQANNCSFGFVEFLLKVRAYIKYTQSTYLSLSMGVLCIQGWPSLVPRLSPCERTLQR